LIFLIQDCSREKESKAQTGPLVAEHDHAISKLKQEHMDTSWDRPIDTLSTWERRESSFDRLRERIPVQCGQLIDRKKELTVTTTNINIHGGCPRSRVFVYGSTQVDKRGARERENGPSFVRRARGQTSRTQGGLPPKKTLNQQGESRMEGFFFLLSFPQKKKKRLRELDNSSQVKAGSSRADVDVNIEQGRRGREVYAH
jgi:hypothetical protein